MLFFVSASLASFLNFIFDPCQISSFLDAYCSVLPDGDIWAVLHKILEWTAVSATGLVALFLGRVETTYQILHCRCYSQNVGDRSVHRQCDFATLPRRSVFVSGQFRMSLYQEYTSFSHFLPSLVLQRGPTIYVLCLLSRKKRKAIHRVVRDIIPNLTIKNTKA
jgi:hypothetical protein